MTVRQPVSLTSMAAPVTMPLWGVGVRGASLQGKTTISSLPYPEPLSTAAGISFRHQGDEGQIGGGQRSSVGTRTLQTDNPRAAILGCREGLRGTAAASVAISRVRLRCHHAHFRTFHVCGRPCQPPHCRMCER